MTAQQHPALDQAPDVVERAVETVKPRLRGWLHAGSFPVVLLAGIVLVARADAGAARAACAVFAVTSAVLFGVSAVYHRGHWSPDVQRLLRRMDHSNIFLIIAGTYTPLTVLLLPERQARILLGLVWGGALIGVAFRMLWLGAPRWLYTPVYIALGWAAVIYLPEFARAGGTAVLTLIVAGGALYSLGGVVYAAKRPDPSPRWFGFHEVFHALTLAAFATHYVAVTMVATGR